MTLPWFRMDTDFPHHPKVLNLASDPSPQRWRAGFSYVCGIGWSVATGNDGYVPANALLAIHGTRQTAGLLAAHGLWEPTLNGWRIHNYSTRQQLRAVTEAQQAELSAWSERANCKRWHGPDCWGAKGCSRVQDSTG